MAIKFVTWLGGLTNKPTPDDADELYVRQESDNTSYSSTWANIKTALGNVFAKKGAIDASGLTIGTIKLAGRGTAGTGALEEIALGTNLSMTGNTLNAAGGGGGGSPGGSNTQVQYNSAGAFAGAAGVTTTGTEIAIVSGTKSTSAPALTVTQTFNNAGVTFTGILANFTDTASSSGSLLLDLQVGGVSKFNVKKQNGVISLSDLNGSLDIYSSPGSICGQYGAYGLRIRSSATVEWSSSNSSIGSNDLILARDSANTLAQRNGTNAQTFRLCNTYTDASNYERGFMRWASNVLEIGTEAAGTGTARNLVFSTANTGRWGVDTQGNFYAVMSGLSIGTAAGGRPVNIHQTGYWQTSEMTAPAAPAANGVRIYAEDDGAGKTRLMAKFATGAAVQIAIEP